MIAITSGLKDMQGVMNLIWEKLLPAFQPKRLKVDAETQDKLKQKLARLTVRPAEGSSASPFAAKVSNRKFIFPANEQKLESLTLKPNGNGGGMDVSIQMGGETRSFTTGYREWKNGLGSFGPYTNAPAAATCAWPADDTLVLKQCFTETPYYVTHKFRFDGDQVFYDAQRNVGFGPTKQPQMVGRTE